MTGNRLIGFLLTTSSQRMAATMIQMPNSLVC